MEKSLQGLKRNLEASDQVIQRLKNDLELKAKGHKDPYSRDKTRRRNSRELDFRSTSSEKQYREKPSPGARYTSIAEVDTLPLEALNRHYLKLLIEHEATCKAHGELLSEHERLHHINAEIRNLLLISLSDGGNAQETDESDSGPSFSVGDAVHAAAKLLKLTRRFRTLLKASAMSSTKLWSSAESSS